MSEGADFLRGGSNSGGGQNLGMVLLLLLIFIGMVYFAISHKPITQESIKASKEFFNEYYKDYEKLKNDFSFLLTPKDKEKIEKSEVRAIEVYLRDTIPTHNYKAITGLYKDLTFLVGKNLGLLIIFGFVFMITFAILKDLSERNPKKPKANVIVIQDKKIKKAIKKTLELLKKYECPASMTYHSTDSRGLLRHSIKVAKKSIEILRRDVPDCTKIQEDFVALLSLLHDIGKLRVYYYKKVKRKLNTKTPFGEKVVESYEGWATTGLPIPANTKIVISKILRESGFMTKEIEYINMLLAEDDSVMKTEEMEAYFSIVKEADMLVTKEELQTVTDDRLVDAVREALKRLNINGITGAYYDAWLTDTHLFVIAWKLAEQVAIVMNATTEDLEDIAFLDRQGSHKLHPIVPILVATLKKHGLIYEEFVAEDGTVIKGDDLALFDARLSGVLFRGLFILKPEILSEEVRMSVGKYEGKVIVRSRIQEEEEDKKQDNKDAKNSEKNTAKSNTQSSKKGEFLEGV